MTSHVRSSNPGSALRHLLVNLILVLSASKTLTMKTIELSVLEEQPARTFVGDLGRLVEASSNPGDGSVQFFFRHPFKPPYNLFSVVQSTSHIVTTRSINREHVCSKDLSRNRNPLLDEPCLLNLELHVRTSPRQESTVKLRVEITDINDNPPVFYQPGYSLEANENSPLGSLFKLPDAVDPDIGVNAIQDYRLEIQDTTTVFPFSLVYDENERTNEMELCLKLTAPLDRELQAGYQAVVIATDGGEPQRSASMTLSVRVLDYNDNIPRFDSETYKIDISENLPVGTTVLRVYAEDRDSGDNGKVEYKLVGSSEADHGEIFGVEKSSGSIILKSRLDYETTKSYQLVVQASDLGTTKQSSFVGVTINILDENDNAPLITIDPLAASGRYEVTENYPSHSSIAYLSATDLDQGKNGEVSCSILNALPHSGKLAIDGDDSDEEESRDFYQNDAIFVNDYQDQDLVDLALEDRKHRSSRHSETQARPYEALSLFRLEHFFNSDYKLETAKSLDRERSSHYRLAIECSDHGAEPTTSVVTIDVKILDQNDNPPIFESDYIEFKVKETVEVGTLLTVLSAGDADEGDNAVVVYDIEPLSLTQVSSGETLEEKDQIMRYVRLDQSSGQLFAASPFDFETMPRDLKYRVVATDRGDPRLSSWVSLTITIIDEDDERPVFDQSLYAFSVSESADPGHILGTVRATDDDSTKEFRQIVYHLQPSMDSGSFQIDPKVGILKTSTRLDRETKEVYRLIVIASNPLDPSRRLTSTANISVTVLDTNDNPPIFIFPEKFRLSHVSVPLDSSPGTHMTKAVATDIDTDENASIYYSIVIVKENQDNGREMDNLFTVDRLTGDLTNAVTLDSEKTYKLLLLAEDGGSPQLSATAELLISVNGSLSGKGAALKSNKDSKVPDEEAGLTWFGLDGKYYLPLLLAMCCGAVGVLALVLAVAVVILCRKKRRSDRKLRQVAQEKSDSMISSRNNTGSLICEISCDDMDKCRWPDETQVEDKWKVIGSVPSVKVCTSDKCRQLGDIKRSRSERRCPVVGGCESDRSCGEFCSGGYTDCESCKESLADARDDELCHLKVRDAHAQT